MSERTANAIVTDDDGNFAEDDGNFALDDGNFALLPLVETSTKAGYPARVTR